MIIPNECRENASYTPAEPCIPPEGTIQITENGLIDVAQFANADVNVSGGESSLEIAEVINYDKLLVQDEGITLPSYTTSEVSLIASEYQEAITLDFDHYNYCVAAVGLAYPIYDNFPDQASKHEFSFSAGTTDILNIPAGTITSQSGRTYDNAIRTSWNNSARVYSVYHLSSSSMATSNSVGAFVKIANPNFSGDKLKLSTPSLCVKGSATVYKSEAWSATTDIRYQYKVYLFRQGIDSPNAVMMSISGLLCHAANCYSTPLHTLT